MDPQSGVARLCLEGRSALDALVARRCRSSVSEHRLTRRELVRRAGIGVAAVVAIGGASIAFRLVQQNVLAPGMGGAYAAWSARLVGDGALSLVRAAVLAANAHNTQPWLFDVDARRIDLFAIRSRNIGTLDPLHREMEVSFGCAIENLTLAARANALAADVRLLPSTDMDHIARITLDPAPSAASPLFDAIPLRRTDRTAYAPRPVERSLLDAIASLAEDPAARLVWLDADPERSRFGEITSDATAAIIADADQSRDDFRWYRQDWDEIQRLRDGITLDAAGVPEPLRTVARVLPPSDAGTLQSGWLDSTRTRHVATAAAFGLVLVREPRDTRARVAAGRLFERVHLSATARGLALQPLNQVIERADREAAAGLAPTLGPALRHFGPDGWHVVMAFRIGHPTRQPYRAPRLLAEEVIRNA